MTDDYTTPHRERQRIIRVLERHAPTDWASIEATVQSYDSLETTTLRVFAGDEDRPEYFENTGLAIETIAEEIVGIAMEHRDCEVDVDVT